MIKLFMREEDTAKVGNWASWGPWRLPVCVQQSLKCLLCSRCVVGRGGGTEKRKVTVQPSLNCTLLCRDIDASGPVSHAGLAAMQMLGKEELGDGLGHPGLKVKKVTNE